MTFYPYLWHGAFDQVGDVVLGISQAGQTVGNLQVLHNQSEAIPQNRTRVLDLLVCYVYPCKFYTTKLAFQKNSQMNCSIPINVMHIVCITVTTSLNNSTGIHLKMFVLKLYLNQNCTWYMIINVSFYTYQISSNSEGFHIFRKQKGKGNRKETNYPEKRQLVSGALDRQRLWTQTPQGQWRWRTGRGAKRE